MSDAPVSTSTAKLVYIMFLANLIIPFLGLIGLVMAYVNKADAPEWLQTHYQFQIRTFWISILYFVIGSILTVVIIGWLVILFTLVWIVIRNVNGMKFLDAQQAHPNPTAWMFS
ncbi:MAG: hypothetical protein COA90_05880 [Gammaproteobacteria bacterium]|nr:MAG: hypothetical protein COA90_05880 [Gammaproteobacteria bacterium]